MFEFFSQIVGFFETIFSVIVNLFESLFIFLSSLIGGTVFASSIVSFFPPILGASMLAIVAIAVLKLIIGR